MADNQQKFMVQAVERTRIAELRDRAGLTQRALALHLDVTENTIQNWEKGKAGFEQIVRVIKLTYALECNWKTWVASPPDIAALRDRAGLTQRALALHLGVTENTIQNWEKGKSGFEQIIRVVKLAQLLKCDLKDLINWNLIQDTQQPKGMSLDEIRLRLGTSKTRQDAAEPLPVEPGLTVEPGSTTRRTID